MLSLEPATVTDRRYPLLFQTGETAYGAPLVDSQHPHNFIMSLGFHYVHRIAEDTTLDLYFAPVGDPALGPVAYPHRASAMELPQAPISHHWQDSTHIADEVVTWASLQESEARSQRLLRDRAGENRWIIETGPINSWSTRCGSFPGRTGRARSLFGRLAHPEELKPGDQVRVTASLEYTRPMNGASWSSSLIWGRTHSTATLRNLNPTWLNPSCRSAAGTSSPAVSNWWIRTNCSPIEPDLEQRLDTLYGSTFRIGAYTLRVHARYRSFSGRRNRHRREFYGLLVAGRDQAILRRSSGGGNIFVRFRLRSR